MPGGGINSLQLDVNYLNKPTLFAPCDGVNMSQLRSRLRAMLSSYAIDTLIPSDPLNDLEGQYINDGIGQLWPHDYRVDMNSQVIVSGNTTYLVPDECEFVLGVYTALKDINTAKFQLESVPQYDGWMFENSFMEATTLTDPTWVNKFAKVIRIVDPYVIRASSNYASSGTKYLVVRYARRWPTLSTEDQDCINPSANRVQAIIFYAAHEYVTSQYEVNSESIRYQNYMGIANRFYQQYMQMLVKDSKPLYVS